MTKARDLSQTPNASLGFKNRIINGAMMIDQRNAGASVTPAGAATTYTLDRWNFYLSQASKLTTQRSTVAPAGFVNSLLVTSSSAYSVLSSDEFDLIQYIEGFNTADLGWGTANAAPVTLSFWVRSSLTGTFGGAIQNGGTGGYRSYPFSYTINAANTFEYKTVTIAGDTSGTWGTANGIGLNVVFGLGQGSNFSGTAGAWVTGNRNNVTGATSVVGTNGATFYITGVQLEKGSTATSFDYRPYGTELALCQRYYYKSPQTAPGEIFTVYQTNAGIVGTTCFPVTMRATPTMTYGYSTPYSGNTFYQIVTGGVTTWTLTDARASASRMLYVYDNTKSGLALGDGYTTYLTASAEL